jgi:hypothetical protein
MGRVACRSKRAEAKKAVAVSAAKETSASTLIKAKPHRLFAIKWWG